MTLAASLRPVAFSVQVHTAPNLPLERDKVGVRVLPRPMGQQGPVLRSPLGPGLMVTLATPLSGGSIHPTGPNSLLKWRLSYQDGG